MPLVILKTAYVKSERHFTNYLEYSNSKIEAQSIAAPDGSLHLISADDILANCAPSDKILLSLRSGQTVSVRADEYGDKVFLRTEENEITEEICDDGTRLDFDNAKWLGYIANRPSATGLFNQFGAVEVDDATALAQQYPGSLKWTHIVSLSREDAERTGFDNPTAWQRLIAAKLPELCKIYNISPQNAVLNCSYHDKDHHPHIHIFMYSKDSREGHFRGAGALEARSRRTKSLFTNEIFRGDLEYLKLDKDKFEMQLKEALKEKLIAIGRKRHNPPPEYLKEFTELADMLLDSKGRKYYEYQSHDTKKKVCGLLKTVVSTDKYLSEIFASLKTNHRVFVAAYNDSEEKIDALMQKWENDFFEPEKQQSKELHNCVIAYAQKISAIDPSSSEYALAQRYYEITPQICSIAEIGYAEGSLSLTECALIKDNVLEIAKEIMTAVAVSDDLENAVDKTYERAVERLLGKRLLNTDIQAAMYSPSGEAYMYNGDERILNSSAYAKIGAVPIEKKEYSLFRTAERLAAAGSGMLPDNTIIVLHNGEAYRAFIIDSDNEGKVKSLPVFLNPILDGLLPGRDTVGDDREEQVADDKPDVASASSRAHHAALEENALLPDLKHTIRVFMSDDTKSRINSIAAGRPFYLLPPMQRGVINDIVAELMRSAKVKAAFDGVICEQERIYTEKYGENEAKSLTEYTVKHLLSPDKYEPSPMQNTLCAAAMHNPAPTPEACTYTSKLLLCRVAYMITSQAFDAAKTAARENGEAAREKRRTKTALERTKNRNISRDDGYEY